MPEVPEEEGGVLAGVVVLGPAEVGLTGEREVGAGVDCQGWRTGGVVLLQRIVTQLTVLVPAHGLLGAGGEGGEGEPETNELHVAGKVVITDQAERVHSPTAGGPRQEVTEERSGGRGGGLSTGPGQTDLGQEILTLEVAQVTAVTVTEINT